MTNLIAFIVLLGLVTTVRCEAYKQRQMEAHDEYVYMIRFSADGTMMATAAGDNTAILWDWKTRTKKHILEHESAVYAAIFHPVKPEVATASGDGNVSIWSTRTGELLRQSKQHQDAVYCIDYSPNGTRLFSVGGHGKKGDTRCRIWDSSDLKLQSVRDGHERPAYGVTVSAAGDAFVTTGGDRLIFLHTLEDTMHQALRGHTSDVYRCDLSPDGRWLASASQDHTVRIWDVAKHAVQHVLADAADPMYDVQFSADGRQLVAVGDDGKVRIWQTDSFKKPKSVRLSSDGLYAGRYSPRGTHIIAGGVDGMLYLHSASTSGSGEAADE